MARGYTVPWKIGQQGLAAQVAKHGFVDLSVPGAPYLPVVRVTFLGDWSKPERQFIRYTALNPNQSHYVYKATWSNGASANDHLIEGFRQALGNISAGLGNRVDEFVSRETGNRVLVTRNYEQARQTLISAEPDNFTP